MNMSPHSSPLTPQNKKVLDRNIWDIVEITALSFQCLSRTNCCQEDFLIMWTVKILTEIYWIILNQKKCQNHITRRWLMQELIYWAQISQQTLFPWSGIFSGIILRPEAPGMLASPARWAASASAAGVRSAERSREVACSKWNLPCTADRNGGQKSYFNDWQLTRRKYWGSYWLSMDQGVLGLEPSVQERCTALWTSPEEDN